MNTNLKLKKIMIKFIKNIFRKHEQLNISVVMCSVCGSKNITTKEQMRRTGGKLHKGRMMSYGYFLNVHYCNDCQNVWDGERTRNS